jgi:cell division septation protein DedD
MTAPHQAAPQAARAPERHSPDAYAVGVRVLRIAPAWLLSTTAGFALLILLLSWMRAGEGVAVVTAHVAHNDARSSKPAAAAPAARESSHAAAPAAEAVTPAAVESEKSHAPADVASPPAETPKPSESARAAEPAAPAAPADRAAKFTVQVGSFNDQSEANERVSALRAAGLDARSTAVEIKGRGTWHRVQVGRFADRARASEGLAGVRAKGGAAGAIVVPIQD